MGKERFEEFIATIIEEGDGEYADGTSMTEDAYAFLNWYRQLNQLWLTVKRLYYTISGRYENENLRPW